MILGLIFISVGLYYIIGMLFFQPWFRDQPKVQRIAEIIGENKIVGFYIIAGIILITIGSIMIKME